MLLFLTPSEPVSPSFLGGPLAQKAFQIEQIVFAITQASTHGPTTLNLTIKNAGVFAAKDVVVGCYDSANAGRFLSCRGIEWLRRSIEGIAFNAGIKGETSTFFICSL
jgi:hypothetical protein